MVFTQVRSALTNFGVFTSRPLAFFGVFTYGVLWLIFDPGSLNWNGVAMLATWMMTLIIQRAGHRDTQAIHAKLDDLLRAESHAHEEFAQIDRMQPEDIEEFRVKQAAD